MADKVLVGIVMGSDSDLETMQEAMKTFISAHRTPHKSARCRRKCLCP